MQHGTSQPDDSLAAAWVHRRGGRARLPCEAWLRARAVPCRRGSTGAAGSRCSASRWWSSSAWARCSTTAATARPTTRPSRPGAATLGQPHRHGAGRRADQEGRQGQGKGKGKGKGKGARPRRPRRRPPRRPPRPVAAGSDRPCPDNDVFITPTVAVADRRRATSRSCSTSRPGQRGLHLAALRRHRADEHHVRARPDLAEQAVPRRDRGPGRRRTAGVGHPGAGGVELASAPTRSAPTAPRGRCPASTTSGPRRWAARRPTCSSSSWRHRRHGHPDRRARAAGDGKGKGKRAAGAGQQVTCAPPARRAGPIRAGQGQDSNHDRAALQGCVLIADPVGLLVRGLSRQVDRVPLAAAHAQLDPAERAGRALSGGPHDIALSADPQRGPNLAGLDQVAVEGSVPGEPASIPSRVKP